MMGVHHRDRSARETVAGRQVYDLVSVVIRHQEIAFDLFYSQKQSFVIEFVMRVEACSGPFPAFSRRVRWVNEENRCFLRCIFVDSLYTVALYKCDFVANMSDVLNALSQCFRIPARLDPFAILTILQYTASGSQYPAVIRSVS